MAGVDRPGRGGAEIGKGLGEEALLSHFPVLFFLLSPPSPFLNLPRRLDFSLVV